MRNDAPARMRGWRAVCCVSVIFAAGCAPRVLSLPTDRADPLPDAAAVHAGLTRACAGVRTMTAELGLSGRAGGQRLRGRAVAGFEAPRSMRLEGLAPFGAPAFILVAAGADATLLLPRDGRVLRGAKAEEILGALTGVSLAPGALTAILTGCVADAATAVRGWQHRGDWISIELSDGTILYAAGPPDARRLRAARRGDWQIQYEEWQGRFPAAVRLLGSTGEVDITARVSQLETNVALDPAAFRVDVPRDALPITLEELRDAGPLRGAQGEAPDAADRP